ncbi:hypothetical protein DESC_460094 [Desulfosarcina cetonica]|nr:hypothetical protein DESC_460094 [Desulfosarcina cetonica]
MGMGAQGVAWRVPPMESHRQLGNATSKEVPRNFGCFVNPNVSPRGVGRFLRVHHP